ncbi:MAG: prepilin peptidase [Candidatus Margulisiibacteriota bacterium]
MDIYVWVLDFCSLLILGYLFWTDLRDYRLPYVPQVGLLLFLGASQWVKGLPFYPLSMAVAAFGMTAILLLGQWILKKPAMGWGDVSLATVLALTLDWMSLGIMLELSFVLGAVVGVGLWATKRLPEHGALPFGPFLMVAYGLTRLWFVVYGGF